jgi:hypothetical protein
VELLPFQWEVVDDQEAAEKTFMPVQVRRRLCPERFREVSHRAFDLCGGHPYFLAMLGYATALAWRGSPVTPAGRAHFERLTA